MPQYVWRTSCTIWDYKACFAMRPASPMEPIFDILDEFDMIRS